VQLHGFVAPQSRLFIVAGIFAKLIPARKFRLSSQHETRRVL